MNNLTRIRAQNAMQNGQIPLSGKMQIIFSTQNHLFLKETKSVAFKPAMQNFYTKLIPFNLSYVLRLLILFSAHTTVRTVFVSI